MFYRKIQVQLLEYYNNPEAKILVINGARQIGKSFIIRETASNFFNNYVFALVEFFFDRFEIFV